MYIFPETPDVNPIVSRPNRAIPNHVLLEMNELIAGGMRLEDTVTYIRGKLVPPGDVPHPFRKNTDESLLDKLRSIVATYTFRSHIKELQQEGVDFSQHLYVPEVDPVTEQVRYDSADHNHLSKRIVQHVRDGVYTSFDYEAFSDVLSDPLSGSPMLHLLEKGAEV